MKIKYFYTLDLIIAALIAITFIALGSNNDFLYSSNIAMGDSVWIEIVSLIFSLPMYVALSLAAVSLFFIRKTKTSTFNIISIIGIVVCLAVQVILLTLDIKDIVEMIKPDLSSSFKYIIAIVIAVIINLLCLIGMFYVAKNKPTEDLFKITLMLAISIAIQVVLVFGLKYLWGRPRYNYLMTLDDPQSAYHPWWVISPSTAGDSFASFPSGHVAKAASAFGLCGAFSILFRKLQSRMMLTILFYSSLAWCILTAFIRILSGNHFITDVSFSILICLVIIGVTTYFVYCFQRKTKVSKKE